MYDLLKGLRVVEGSAFIAAPLGGMTLAQLGADVIRFDPIGGGLDYGRWPITGDGVSLYWAGLNKGKRSIAINLRTDEGRELATALATASGENAGIFLTNFPLTGWLNYDRLKALREDLIMVNVQGNSDGSSALDYTINCAAGFPFATGEATSERPVNHMFPAWDALTGVNAALAVVAAERHRRQTNEGQLVQLSLADIAFAMVGNLGLIAETAINGAQRTAIGNRVFGAFGLDFATSDGVRIMIVAVTRRQWRGLVKATGLAAEMEILAARMDLNLDEEGDRYRATDEIGALVGPWCAARELSEIATQFDADGVCWGPYQSFGELVRDDPRCSTDNPVFERIRQPGVGSYLTPGSPLRFSGLERRSVAPAPTLGADTDAVLNSLLGLSDHVIGDLHDRGVVAGPVG